jgi:hypothetical protein
MLGPELVSIDVARVTRTGRCVWCRWRDCGSARLELMRAMYMYMFQLVLVLSDQADQLNIAHSRTYPPRL